MYFGETEKKNDLDIIAKYATKKQKFIQINIASTQNVKDLPKASYYSPKILIEERYLIPNYDFGFQNKYLVVNQVQRITKLIGKELDINKVKYCCRIVLDVAQVYDKVWHKILLLKLQKDILLPWCELLEYYFTQ